MGLAKLPGSQVEVLDIAGDDLGALIGLRQQPGIVAVQHRHHWFVVADGHQGLGDFHFGGGAEKAEFIHRFAGQAIALQGACAAATATGIELDADQSQHVQAKAHRAFGET
ncbi:hypothetical protein D3C76_1010350 [compost metagenome]